MKELTEEQKKEIENFKQDRKILEANGTKDEKNYKKTIY